jgi:membrane protein
LENNGVAMASSGRNTDQQVASIWKLGGLTIWQLTRKVLHGIIEDDLFGRASELAFNFLLALFPLLLFMLVIFGLFASRSAHLSHWDRNWCLLKDVCL